MHIRLQMCDRIKNGKNTYLIHHLRLKNARSED